MIKAVFFDLDGTLYDRDALVLKVVQDQFAAFQGELQDLAESFFIERILELDDHGYGEKIELYQKVTREWGLHPGLGGRLVSDFWRRYDESCQLSTDTRSTLQSLRTHGKKVGVITNGATVRQRLKLERLGLNPFLDAVLISEAEGIRKPDKQIFRSAMDRCGVFPEESVFVGDHPDVDVAGSLAAGMIAIWKRVPYWSMKIDKVDIVDNLSEILPICL